MHVWHCELCRDCTKQLLSISASLPSASESGCGVGPPAAEVKDKDQAQEVTGKGHQLGQPEG